MSDIGVRGVVLIGLGFLFVAIILVGMAALNPTYAWGEIGLQVTYPILWIAVFTIVVYFIWRLIH